MSKQPNYVFVLDTKRKPLIPCKPSVARKLLNAGKAKVFRLYPFTIILNKEVTDNPKTLTLKIDPGSKVTGLAILFGSKLLWVAELTHRGQSIKASLESRRSLRQKGFQTGDIVKAIVTSGKKVGTYTGRISVRSTGSFNISTTNGLIQGISHKYCQQVHKKDGYGYGF